MCLYVCVDIFFVFFKQKTSYEMRISDWSSDVCSSDLVKAESEKSEIKKALYVSLFGLSSIDQVKRKLMEGALPDAAVGGGKLEAVKNLFKSGVQIGRASCRARVCKYV